MLRMQMLVLIKQSKETTWGGHFTNGLGCLWCFYEPYLRVEYTQEYHIAQTYISRIIIALVYVFHLEK